MTTRPRGDDETTPEPQASYEPAPRRGGYQRQSIGEAAAKSFIRSVAASLGRIVVRMITGRLR